MNPDETESRFDRLGLPDGERDAIRLEHLDQSLRDAYSIVDELEERARTKRHNAELLKELHARQRELIAELQLTERVRLTEERLTREAVRAFEVEKARVERARTRVDWPRRGRPVRIDVDDHAWATLNRAVIARRGTMIRRLGELATVEADKLTSGKVTGTPASRRRRSPGENPPIPTRRFLRILINDNAWAVLRVNAHKNNLTMIRYLGEIAEAEAHHLGSRAQ